MKRLHVRVTLPGRTGRPSSSHDAGQIHRRPEIWTVMLVGISTMAPKLAATNVPNLHNIPPGPREPRNSSTSPAEVLAVMTGRFKESAQAVRQQTIAGRRVFARLVQLAVDEERAGAE